MQTKIPCVIMRGDTSSGPFFYLPDLPADIPTRDAVLLCGSHSVTSKVAMISKSRHPGADVD